MKKIIIILMILFSSSLSAFGFRFRLINTLSIKNFGTYRAWIDGSFADSCQSYRSKGYYGSTGSGTYRVSRSTIVSDVYCDMETENGGWTRFHTFTITNGKYSTVNTPYPAKEFLGKYTGMIYYNYYGASRDTHQIFDVFVTGESKICYSKWHNSSKNITNLAARSPQYSGYAPACTNSTGNYAQPTPGYYTNTFLNVMPAGKTIFFGDHKNLSNDYSWDGSGYTGSQTFEIFYR